MTIGEKHNYEAYVAVNVKACGEETKKYLFTTMKKARIAQKHIEEDWHKEGFRYYVTETTGDKVFVKKGRFDRTIFLSIEDKEKPLEDIILESTKIENPTHFIKNFDSDQEFRQWCEQGTVKDLQCTLKAFEAAEEYEHCKIINEVLKSKANEQ